MNSYSLTNNDQSREDRDKQQKLAETGKLPRHIAIIMDGNGRWARQRGHVRAKGHKVGVESVRDITEACAQMGVEYLTLYTFSTENWERPSREIDALMKLLVSTLRKEARKLNENDIQLESIGQTDRFPDVCCNELREAKELTKDNDRMQLCLALSYSGRWDITQAARQIAYEVKKGNLEPDEIDEKLISNYLSTAGKPDPDLIVRTGGEFRISNYLLWQIAYSEWYITETLWPDFRRDNLYEAIRWFQQRDRRFGKLSEQTDDESDESWLKKAFS